MSIFRVTKKLNTLLSVSQKKRIAGLIILMVIGGILETFSVSLILPFVNVAMDQDTIMEKDYVRFFCQFLSIESPRTLLIILAVLLAIIYIFKNIFLLFEYDIQYKFVYRSLHILQKQLFNNILQMKYEYYLKINSPEVIRVIGNDALCSFQLLGALLNLFTELFVSAMLIGAIFIMAPTVTIFVALMLIIILYFTNRLLKPRLKNASRSFQEGNAGINKWLIQAIQGIKEVKVMMREIFFKEKFEQYSYQTTESIRKNQLYFLMPRFIVEGISMAIMFLATAILIYRGMSLKTIVPMLSTIAMAAIRLLPSVNRISSGLTNVSYNEPMLDKLIEYLSMGHDDHEAEYETVIERKWDDSIFTEKWNILRVNEVSFHYPESEELVLEDASMIVKRGESVGIIGGSGAGKTTVVDIILGLLIPQKGNVEIDGRDIYCCIDQWLSKIAYIPQMIFMLDDSIRANVVFGNNADSNDDKVWDALKAAALDDFVSSLPEGLDTQIGERGVRLSGGQRQRIGIARALYIDPQILIFDEATSALDNETESDIIDSINTLRGQKTMIIIAHRLSTIEACDRVFRVNEKKIFIEQGG